MDLSFSAKSQTLTLISSAQISSPLPTRSLRREFLGNCHNLRPPGGQLRGSKCGRVSRERQQSRRLLVKASIDSSSVPVLIAVTAFSALSIVYLNHRLSKSKNEKKSNAVEVLRASSLVLSELGRNTVNHIIGNRFLDVQHPDMGTAVVRSNNLVEEEIDNGHLIEDAEEHTQSLEIIAPVAQSKSLMDQVMDNIHVFEGKDSHTHIQETILENGGPLLVKTTESPVAVALASDACDCLVSKEHEATTLSPPTSVLPELGGESLIFATEGSKLALEECKKEIEFGSMFHEIVAKTESTAASIPPTRDSARKADISNFICIMKNSDREDLYTFCGANQSAMESPLKVNGFKAVYSAASFLNSNNFTSSKLANVPKAAELSAQHSRLATESVDRKVPLASSEGGSAHENKNSRRSRIFRGDKQRKQLIQASQTKLPQLSHQNGIDAGKKDHSSKQWNAYNCFLRDGRLAQCVDFLEDMERRGLLDMSKIYHAKFFQTCKGQKAVKEAFRFCKLVPNPTLSTFNMLMSVCASSQDSEGAFEVLRLAQRAGFKADCKLYTTLISTCAKSGKVDAMFEVFHEMVNAGVVPNVHTYGALIDGCARVGQVAKAFGAYGIMRSKNVKPDRVVFNALISACGQSGAVDRAFDVLAEMSAETQPIDPDHITVGALMKACANAGQVDRAKEVYNMVNKYGIKGTPDVYTIAINCCSQTGDWEFVCTVYSDMTRKGIVPDEMFFSALIDVAGHAGKLDAAFEILQEARSQGTQLGSIPYSSLMGACCNAKNWQKALELYEDMKSIKVNLTVSTMNALITALCDGDQLPKAIKILSEMRSFGLCPNTITYSVLFVASERNDDLDAALMLLSQAKEDSVGPTLLMFKCIIGMCLRRFEKACTHGEPVLSFHSGRPQIVNKWTSLALTVYRETIAIGEKPTLEVVSQVLGCLRLPCDATVKNRLVENLEVAADSSRYSNLYSLIDGFGEYDPRSFSLFEEVASLGIVPCVSFKQSPILVDAKNLPIHTAEVYLLTIFKGLKHRLAAGAKLPNVIILLPVEKAHVSTPEGEKKINITGRVGQSIAALLRRLGIPYQGNESNGKIRINGISLRRWFQPKLASPFSGKPEELGSFQLRIGKGIIDQQRSIRTGNLSLE